MVAVIDYDAGNIKSVLKAFRYLGQDVELTRDPEIIRRADHVVLPGVGAFGDAMKRLADYGLVDVISTGDRDQDHPHRKEMQKCKMAVWGGLTNSCEKKRSEKQRRKGKM